MSVNGRYSEDDEEIFGPLDPFHPLSNSKSLLDAIIDDSVTNSLCDPIQPPIVIEKLRQWEEIVELAKEIFYNPDIEGLQAVLGAYAAHFFEEEKAVWLMVVGPPSTGKTALAIGSLQTLRDVEVISNMTPKSISSGYGKHNGLLAMAKNKYEGKVFILFPDFGTILTKNDQDIRSISGQFRAIHDGEFGDNKGNSDEINKWKGKLSIVAAVTEDIERAWSMGRSLGERFINIRWRSDTSIGERVKAGNYANEQIHNNAKLKTLFDLISKYVDIKQGNMSFKESMVPKKIAQIVVNLSVLVGTLRTNVTWGGRNYNTIVGKDSPEGAGRLTKQLMLEVKGLASLARRTEVNYKDVDIAKRIAWDTIPKNRSKIIKYLVDNDKRNAGIDQRVLQSNLSMTDTPFDRAIEELITLEAIVREEKLKVAGYWVKMTSDLFDLCHAL